MNALDPGGTERGVAPVEAEDAATVNAGLTSESIASRRHAWQGVKRPERSVPACRDPCLSGFVHETPQEPTTCSALSEWLAEPLPGTAAVARAWLCIEQPGPWGHNALLDSRFEKALGEELAKRANGTGVRLQMIRRPGERADRTWEKPRRVYLASTDPAHCWLREATVYDPAELLELDFAAIARGVHNDWGHRSATPLMLVCTNGRRDQCCAVWGRPLAAGLAADHPDSVWETSHTGGHRFAPAAVVLPSGYTYGRVKPVEADAILTAAKAGNVTLNQCRGRSTWSRSGQAAELALRTRTGELSTNAFHVEEAEPAAGPHNIRLSHTDGRTWSATIHEEKLEPPRPSSCGKNPSDVPATTVEAITPLPRPVKSDP